MFTGIVRTVVRVKINLIENKLITKYTSRKLLMYILLIRERMNLMATKDVEMYWIEDDIEKIQKKTNMYIKSYNSAGAFHLVREIVQNAIDECIDEDSPGKKIYVSYDILTDMLTCEDDGRGFPEVSYPLDIFCTKIQSGSKFFRASGASSAGEFGLGLTACNALAKYFSIASFRAAEKTAHTIDFEDGKKTKDEMKKLDKNVKEHGTIIKFIPSKERLGASTVIPYKEMIEWIDKMSYFLVKGVEIRVDIFKGTTLKETYKYKARPFVQLLDKLTTDNYSPKVEMVGDDYIEEGTEVLIKKNGKDVTKFKIEKKKVHMEMAFRYSTDPTTVYDTYCNYTNTIDGGVHQDTFEQCLCRYLVSETNKTMTENQREKTKILWEDVRTGLNCVINLSTNAQVGFVGNAKEKIGNEALVPVIKAIVNKALLTYFEKNQNELSAFIKIVKMNAKARIEAAKVKTAIQVDKLNSFKAHEMKNYIQCNNRGKNQYRELFIVEGDSASGCCRNASDSDFQSIFLLRGVTLNAWKAKNLAEVMQNREFKDLVTVLGCGIGQSFDIKKLRYERICIFSDADTDGFYITAGVLGFLYRFLPELIRTGHVYKVFTPLYQIDDKNHKFVMSKSDLIEVFYSKIMKTYKLSVVYDKNNHTFSKDEFYEFLKDTYDYRENLIRSSNNLGHVNKYLVEAIVAYLVMAGIVTSSHDIDKLKKSLTEQEFIKYFMGSIQKRFKEMELNNDIISGIADGHFYSIKLDSYFLHQIEDLIPIIRKYGYKVESTEKGKEPRVMTISEFLEDCTKLTPKISHRFKGLGEINGHDLKATSMDINNRFSVLYTMDDAAKEIAIFKKTQGNSKDDLIARKKMISEFKISREDLDN